MSRYLVLRILVVPLFLLLATPLSVCAVSDTEWLSLQQQVLPPAIPWDGNSRSLALHAGDAWVTPCERNDLKTTPRYRETIAWLDSL